MFAQITDLRLCALMSLRLYVLTPLCPCPLMSALLCPAFFCLRPYVRFRIEVAYGINRKLFYQLHIDQVCSVLRPLGWYKKGLPWNSVMSWRIEILWR